MILLPSGAPAPPPIEPIRWERAIDEGRLVQGPAAYSSEPRIVVAGRGSDYYTKGPNGVVVFAEYIAYTLASIVKLATPDFALIRTRAGGVLFGSEKKTHRFEAGIMAETGIVDNEEILAECTVFDIWIANDDRNSSQFVGDDVGGRELPAEVRLFAIDFEKSHLLRGESQLMLAKRPSTDFLPTQPLRDRVLRQPFPQAICERIEAVTEPVLTRVIEQYVKEVAPIEYAERVVFGLVKRGQTIRALAREAWG